MDLATYHPSVVKVYEKLAETHTTSPASVEAPFTTTDCEHCGKPFKEGDSILLKEDGKISQCQHWNL